VVSNRDIHNAIRRNLNVA